MTECRFGFLESLRQWDGNDAARRGLDGCLQVMVEVALRRRDAEGARALLAELDQAVPALEGRVTALQQELEEERRRDGELRRMADDLDASVSARQRLAGISALCVFGAVVAAFAMVRRASGGLTHMHIVVIAGAMVSLGGLSALVMRRHVLSNAFNRRAFGLVVASGLSIFFNRLAGMRFGTSMDQIFFNDTIVFAGVMAAGALTLMRWLWWAVAILVVGGAVSFAVPELSGAAFAIGSTATCVVAILFWRKR